MKTTSVWLAAGAVLMLLAASAVAQDEDDSVLWEWSSPSDIQVWAAYEHILRPLDMDHARKADRTLKGNLGAAGIEWSPLGWFSLGAFAGAAEARIDEYMAECGSLGAGGGLSLGANFWQISAEHHRSAWDVTIRAETRASYWQSGDDGEGSVEWFEGFGALPVRYRLRLTSGIRSIAPQDFHSLAIWAGPAVSVLDGEWERSGMKESFTEADTFGVAGGADMWLIDSLKISGRIEWFGDAGFWVGCTYAF